MVTYPKIAFPLENAKRSTNPIFMSHDVFRRVEGNNSAFFKKQYLRRKDLSDWTIDECLMTFF